MFEDIDVALEYVFKRLRKDQDKDIHLLFAELDNPQDKFKTIHIAGTNGKGSTLSYLRCLLEANGLKVGTFTSPHYEHHLDRIRINDSDISEERFLFYLNKYYSLIEKYNMAMFGIDFLIACAYFLDEGVDVALIEVGIGGRHDITNLLHHPELCIITSVGYDHLELLGDTLAAIASEKVGIVKRDVPLLIGKLDNEAKEVIIKECRDYAPLYEMGEYVDLGEGIFKYKEETYRINNKAKYQLHNASLALEACKVLNYPIHKEALLKMHWRGRFEEVAQGLYFDGAHNEEAMRALIASSRNLKGSLAVICAFVKRKQYLKMLEMWKGNCDYLCLTSFPYDSAVTLDDVDMEGVDKCFDCFEAIADARLKYDNVVVCGSLYFLSYLHNSQFPRK